MRFRQLAVIAAGALALAGFAPGIAMAATCTTSSPTGACGPYSDPNVFIGPNGADLVVQNDFSAIPQTLTANGDNNWTVDASTVGQGDQTSVKSYPATQVTYTLPSGLPEPSADFGTSLISDFTNVVPTGSNQDYEYAVDDWLADPAQQSWTNDLEIMIWTNTNQQVPAGSPNGMTYTDPSGQSWEVWTAGGATTVSPVSTVSFVRGSIANPANVTSGTIDRMGFYGFLQNHGLLAATYGIDQLNYGLEICSTGGATRTYGISNYTTVVNGTQQAQAPVVTTDAASGISQTGATLNGTVNPEGQATTWQYEYGTTTAYGSTAPASPGSAGSGSSAVSEPQAVSGLTAGTLYHYRLNATNGTGTTHGPDQTFTTTSGGGSSVTFDAAAGAKTANHASLSWTHTVGSGTNRALFVGSAVGSTSDNNCSVTVKDGTTVMTRIAVKHTNNQTAGFLGTYALANPPSGANTITISVTGCSGGTPKELTGGSESFTGVNQSTPAGTASSAAGSSAHPAVTVSDGSTADMVAAFAANGNSITSVASPFTSRYIQNQDANTGAGNSAGATAASNGTTVTATWTATTDWWAAIGIPVLHA